MTATEAEIDDWVDASPVRSRFKERKPLLAGRTNRVGADFLQVDCGIALTFSGIALQTSNRKKRRTTQSARKAYDTIMRLRANLDLNEAERGKLDADLQRLKSQIQRLGER